MLKSPELHKDSSVPLADSDLIEQYKRSGDQDGVARLYERYMEMVFAVCIKYLRDSEAAKDAVMDIYGQVAKKLLVHEVSNFKSWLYTLSKNHCLMQLRSASSKRMVNLDTGVVQFAAELHLEEKNETEFRLNQLHDCMEKLSAEQKLVIDLFYLKERSYKEIAEQKHMDWNKVRSLVQNGRRNLKICMEQKIQIPEK